ncbi:hypothetical protein SESBI_10233 [Sesbania bispinosa]|nr:hypothetical protein SESBI_10233 [Sesbania bispinosa]
MPRPRGNTPSIVRPPVQANNFEVKPIMLQVVRQEQFMGLPSEDPHTHIQKFLSIYDMAKMNGVSDDAIRLRHFFPSPAIKYLYLG